MLPSAVKVQALGGALVLFLAMPGPAEARFGKRSAPTNADGAHSATGGDESSPESTVHSAEGSHEHSAEPVQACQQDTCIRDESRPVPPPPPRPGPVVVYVPVPAEQPPPGNDGPSPSPPPAPIAEDVVPPPEAVVVPPPSRSELTTTLLAQAQGYPGGSTLGVQLGVEGARWGAYAQATGILFRGSGLFSDDAIALVNGYVTYALLADPRLRLRLEAGITSAFATDLTTVGPGLGASGFLKVVGPLQLEGVVHGTPFPFRQLDWNAGVGLDFGAIGLHGGWRQIILDDRGLVDGVINRDVFSGPFLALSVAF